MASVGERPGIGSDRIVGELLARAHTLPSSAYQDGAIFRLEQERIFGRTWQVAGPAERLERTGDFLTVTIGGEPLVLTRSDSGVRAMSAVCRHRAGPVATGCGNKRVLQCAYHGWTYTLEGALVGTPEWQGVEDFRAADHALPRFRSDRLGPLAMVNLDAQGGPLEAAVAPFLDEPVAAGIESLRLARAADYQVACNWKAYVDNYLEGYHIPLVHPRLFREVDYANYRVETYELCSKQITPLRAGGALEKIAGSADVPAAVAYYWVFPNTMLNLYPGNLQVNVVEPTGPETTRVRFEWYVADPAAAAGSAGFAESILLAEEVQREDVAICEAVQRGLRSRTYDRGRYSVARENGVHHFHSLWERFMGRGSG